MLAKLLRALSNKALDVALYNEMGLQNADVIVAIAFQDVFNFDELNTNLRDLQSHAVCRALNEDKIPPFLMHYSKRRELSKDSRLILLAKSPLTLKAIDRCTDDTNIPDTPETDGDQQKHVFSEYITKHFFFIKPDYPIHPNEENITDLFNVFETEMNAFIATLPLDSIKAFRTDFYNFYTRVFELNHTLRETHSYLDNVIDSGLALDDIEKTIDTPFIAETHLELERTLHQSDLDYVRSFIDCTRALKTLKHCSVSIKRDLLFSLLQGHKSYCFFRESLLQSVLSEQTTAFSSESIERTAEDLGATFLASHREILDKLAQYLPTPIASGPAVLVPSTMMMISPDDAARFEATDAFPEPEAPRHAATDTSTQTDAASEAIANFLRNHQRLEMAATKFHATAKAYLPEFIAYMLRKKFSTHEMSPPRSPAP